MIDVSTRLNAALSGRYRIERQLGEGGMATVYLADDLKHGRKVALKVLKPELAAAVGAERFLAEIRTTASLQHPHILPLFDSGEADSFLFYVMPFVEGESLRERLDREHQLPVDEAVRIATNVAEALDYAHSRGVIHRDIKPANILLQAGKPVVSDFGIALALTAGGAGRLTETGLSLGTPSYMSPEQATGDMGVGPPADIWALGCVLYEMLVGEPPHTGSTPQAILGKIIAGDLASARKHRASVPANVDAAIRRSLEKIGADRFPTAHDFARSLGDSTFRHGAEQALGGQSSGPWRPLALAATALAAAFAGVTAWALTRPEPPVAVARFESPFLEGQEPRLLGPDGLALSPDGSMIVYSGAGPDGERSALSNQLWVRRWSDLEAVPIQGTLLADMPAVSWDSRSVAFRQDEEVKVMALEGGPARTLGGGVYPRWSPDGHVYFSSPTADIVRVLATGGAPEVVRSNPGDLAEQYAWDFLPGGDLALMFSWGVGGQFDIAVLRLGTGEVTPLGLRGAAPMFSPTGHIAFTNFEDSAWVAARFDPASLAVGAPVPVIEDVGFGWLSRTGAFVYSTFDQAPAIRTRLRLVGTDGAGRTLAELDGTLWFPRFSPDGTRVAFGHGATENVNDDADLWVLDVERGARTRVTFGGNNRYYPIWTRDGTRLTYADSSGNHNSLLSSRTDGSGGVETLLELGDRRFPSSWHPDGRTLAYYVGPAGVATNSRDIWMLRVSGDERTPSPFIETPFTERGAIFSPDGSWVAYVSDKSGQTEVYARPFPGPGEEVTISVGGGVEPAWGPSGNDLFYRREGELVVVVLRRTGASLSVGAPSRVMEDRFRRDSTGSVGGAANYDVAPDGSHFVVLESANREILEPGRVYLVLNWLEELKRLVPN